MTLTEPTNDQRSALEVEAFMRDKPDRYFAYQKHSGSYRGGHLLTEITTWTGDKLADVTETGEAWRSNMGDLRQPFRAKGINGVTYSGVAYLDAGDYVRMRTVKPC